MPAVDTHEPGGLTYEEIGVLVRPLLHQGLAAGVDVTIYDPTLDPGGRAGRELTRALAHMFRGEAF